MSIAEIRLNGEALRHNLRAMRSLVPAGTELIAVVKGNAYGHGMAAVAEILENEVDGFQVDDLEELRELRRYTSKRVLVLGYVPRAEVREAIDLGGELALYDHERLPELSHAKVHLKVDALLGRQGVLPRDLNRMLDEVERVPGLQILTAYGHFANIEDTTDLIHAHNQIEVFDECFARIKARFPVCGRHVSATSGVMTVDPGYDLVRVGIGLYGMYPSGSLERRHGGLDLRPAMTWASVLAQVKVLPKKHPVGYGLTFVTSRETRIGIVPQGYSDGYDRGLSNVGEVLVRGRRCRVLGRVAMNMFAIDLSYVPDAEPEDEVVLLGSQEDDCIAAEEIASRIGTINYEVTTRISPLLARTVR